MQGLFKRGCGVILKWHFYENPKVKIPHLFSPYARGFYTLKYARVKTIDMEDNLREGTRLVFHTSQSYLSCYGILVGPEVRGREAFDCMQSWLPLVIVMGNSVLFRVVKTKSFGFILQSYVVWIFVSLQELLIRSSDAVRSSLYLLTILWRVFMDGP